MLISTTSTCVGLNSFNYSTNKVSFIAHHYTDYNTLHSISKGGREDIRLGKGKEDQSKRLRIYPPPLSEKNNCGNFSALMSPAKINILVFHGDFGRSRRMHLRASIWKG